MNLYGFILNNPFDLLDPLGLDVRPKVEYVKRSGKFYKVIRYETGGIARIPITENEYLQEKLGKDHLDPKRINCVGHARGLNASFQPRDKSIMQLLRAVGWTCEKKASKDCKCRSKTDKVAMVYLYLRLPKDSSIDVNDYMKKWNKKFGDMVKGFSTPDDKLSFRINSHGIKRNCCEKAGTAEA